MSNKETNARKAKYLTGNPFIVGGIFSAFAWALLLVVTHVDRDFKLLYVPTSPLPHFIGLILGILLIWLPILIGAILTLIGVFRGEKVKDKRTSTILLAVLSFVIVYYFLALLVFSVFVHY